MYSSPTLRLAAIRVRETLGKVQAYLPGPVPAITPAGRARLGILLAAGQVLVVAFLSLLSSIDGILTLLFFVSPLLVPIGAAVLATADRSLHQRRVARIAAVWAVTWVGLMFASVTIGIRGVGTVWVPPGFLVSVRHVLPSLLFAGYPVLVAAALWSYADVPTRVGMVSLAGVRVVGVTGWVVGIVEPFTVVPPAFDILWMPLVAWLLVRDLVPLRWRRRVPGAI